MTAFQIYALYISPFVLLIVAGTSAWPLTRKDRADSQRQRQQASQAKTPAVWRAFGPSDE
jgi:cytochrome c-type biogenesis protein CcmH/NrfF